MTQSVESAHENLPGSFRIQLRNPEAVYALLSHGVNAQVISLKDNWEEMYTRKIDLISLIYTNADSQLRMEQVPDWPDRKTKNLELRQLIRLGQEKFDVTYWKTNLDAFKDALEEQGLSAYTATHGSAEHNNPDEKHYVGPECLVIEKNGFSVMITFLKKEFDAPYGEFMIDLHEIQNGLALNPLLDDYTHFLEATSFFLESSEKTIRAMYKMAGKQLPDAPLTFWPETSDKNELRLVTMVCGNCGTGYQEGQIIETKTGLLVGSATCSKCGATNPKILDIPHSGPAHSL